MLDYVVGAIVLALFIFIFVLPAVAWYRWPQEFGEVWSRDGILYWVWRE